MVSKKSGWSLAHFAVALAVAVGAVACGGADATADADPQPAGGDEKASDGSGGDSATKGAGAATTTAAAPAAAVTDSSGAAALPGAAGTTAPTTGTAPPLPAVEEEVVTKLRSAVKGVVFETEAQFPWSVLQADGTGVADLTAAAVAAKLGPTIAKLQGGAGRDLAKLESAVNDDGVDGFLDGLVDDASEEDAAKYAEAKGLIKAGLHGTQVFSFAASDEDADAAGIIVVVGRSASNKLVALVTFEKD